MMKTNNNLRLFLFRLNEDDTVRCVHFMNMKIWFWRSEYKDGSAFMNTSALLFTWDWIYLKCLDIVQLFWTSYEFFTIKDIKHLTWKFTVITNFIPLQEKYKLKKKKKHILCCHCGPKSWVGGLNSKQIYTKTHSFLPRLLDSSSSYRKKTKQN